MDPHLLLGDRMAHDTPVIHSIPPPAWVGAHRARGDGWEKGRLGDDGDEGFAWGAGCGDFHCVEVAAGMRREQIEGFVRLSAASHVQGHVTLLIERRGDKQRRRDDVREKERRVADGDGDGNDNGVEEEGEGDLSGCNDNAMTAFVRRVSGWIVASGNSWPIDNCLTAVSFTHV